MLYSPRPFAAPPRQAYAIKFDRHSNIIVTHVKQHPSNWTNLRTSPRICGSAMVSGLDSWDLASMEGHSGRRLTLYQDFVVKRI